MTQHIEPVAWMWTDSTGCVHMAGDRPDIYTAAATVAQLPEPLYDASALAAALERGRSEERERCAKLELTLTRTLGGLGAAFDPPGPHRAYTYEHQPHNGPAYRLGCAVFASTTMPAGDEIDVGLTLLKAMQARGFGVFEIKPAAITKEPTP